MDGDFDQLRAAFASPQQNYYPSMGDALHEMDERANYGAPGTYHRQLHDQLQSGLAGFDTLRDAMIPKTAADAGEMAAYMTPGLGNALSARDAYEGIQQGDWRKAALGGIGAIPFIGGIFAGPIAKTADHAMLARAGEMAAAGHAPEAIWRDTGWFKGADGKWRFEIPDNASFYRGTGPATDAYADQAFLHPEMYKAYPDFGEVRIKETAEPNSVSGYGTWHPEKGVELGGRDKSSTALHEFQHAIQDTEGFARGANPEDAGWQRVYKTLRNQAAESDAVMQMRGRIEHLGETPQEAADYIAQVRGMDPQRLRRLDFEYPGADMQSRLDRSMAQARDADPYEKYRRTAGEVEARNVQSRMNMTPEERRATPPWETQDVPNDQQILRFR